MKKHLYHKVKYDKNENMRHRLGKNTFSSLIWKMVDIRDIRALVQFHKKQQWTPSKWEEVNGNFLKDLQMVNRDMKKYSDHCSLEKCKIKQLDITSYQQD